MCEGTDIEANSNNGACHIPKPTIKIIANTNTHNNSLGFFHPGHVTTFI